MSPITEYRLAVGTMPDGFVEAYVDVLIGVLKEHPSTELMDRIERLLGVSEPPPNIPKIIPPALLGPGPAVESVEPAVQELEELSSIDVVGEIAVPEIRPESAPPRARALGSQTEACEPGCGQSFGLGTLGRHRAGCAEWLAYRSAHVHDVTDPNWPKPLPAAADDRGGSGDAHADRAAAKAADVWAERHPGEPSQRPLTPRMVETLDALRAANEPCDPSPSPRPAHRRPTTCRGTGQVRPLGLGSKRSRAREHRDPG